MFESVYQNQPTDPRFYDEISDILDDLIAGTRDNAEEYEEFLNQAEQLIYRMARDRSDSEIPEELQNNPEAQILYRNLPDIIDIDDDEGYRLQLALDIDQIMRTQAPAGWRGDTARESQFANPLHLLMGEDAEVTVRLLDLIRGMDGYQ